MRSESRSSGGMKLGAKAMNPKSVGNKRRF